MRVVGGELGSRILARPPRGVRPTSDRVREALFARLGDLRSQVVLDLYAGTGALGIEALSRGAERAVFVDSSARSLLALRENLSGLGLEARSRVIRSDAVRAARRLAGRGECFDLIFLDPPYDSDELERSLAAIVESELLRVGGMVVVETRTGHDLAAVPGLTLLDERGYGETTITRLIHRGRVEAARTNSEGGESRPQRSVGSRTGEE